jgi:hypothetical protein
LQSTPQGASRPERDSNTAVHSESNPRPASSLLHTSAFRVSVGVVAQSNARKAISATVASWPATYMQLVHAGHREEIIAVPPASKPRSECDPPGEGEGPLVHTRSQQADSSVAEAHTHTRTHTSAYVLGGACLFPMQTRTVDRGAACGARLRRLRTQKSAGWLPALVARQNDSGRIHEGRRRVSM